MRAKLVAALCQTFPSALTHSRLQEAVMEASACSSTAGLWAPSAQNIRQTAAAQLLIIASRGSKCSWAPGIFPLNIT